MKYLQPMVYGLEIDPVVAELDSHWELWNQYTLRTGGCAPVHNAVSDIWVRYRAWDEWQGIQEEYKTHCRNGMPWNPDAEQRHKWALADFVAEEHESVWYTAGYQLLALRSLIFELMRHVEAERLGGVLITRIPPGGKVLPHIDRGWHAKYYEKIAVQLKSAPGQAFCYADGRFECPAGTVYAFDNSQEHWVDNDSDVERQTLIICLRRDQRLPPLSRGKEG